MHNLFHACCVELASNGLQMRLLWCLQLHLLLFFLSLLKDSGWFGHWETSDLIWTYPEACDSGSAHVKSWQCHLRFLFSRQPSVLLPVTVESLALMWLDNVAASAPFSNASVAVLALRCSSVVCPALLWLCCGWCWFESSCSGQGQEGVDRWFLCVWWGSVTSHELHAEIHGLASFNCCCFRLNVQHFLKKSHVGSL